MFSVVLSLQLQQETGTEIVRSQGTIIFWGVCLFFLKEEGEAGGVTIARTSRVLVRFYFGVTGSVVLAQF